MRGEVKNIAIIGAGFSGLYASILLAKAGHRVTVFEKNDRIGGRARVYQEKGFTFDMGPSWYWMPELIDQLFEEIGENRSEYFKLIRLNPSYRVFWEDDFSDIPADRDELVALFEGYEQGGGEKLKRFLNDAKSKYEIAIPEYLEKPGLKLNEVVNFKVLKESFKLDVFKSVDKYVRNRFSSPKSIGLLNFPVLFLGEMPSRIPSLYTLMNYADMGLGTWYPEGGMGKLPEALHKVAQKFGVEFKLNASVDAFNCEAGEIRTISVNGKNLSFDAVVASADYNFVEQNLVPKKFRRYSSQYWDTRSLAPSSLIFYLGIDKKLENLEHHNLFFDEDLVAHGKEIYENPNWPKRPLFYACMPSKTDRTVAPEGMENIFILIPIAPNIEDTEELREKYFNIVMNRLEERTGQNIRDHIIYKRSYCIEDFKNDYNAYKGNAYGLANTLKQTANLKPKITSKLDNLFYCGQLTVPGPGVPPALMSGKLVANHLIESYEGII